MNEKIIEFEDIKADLIEVLKKKFPEMELNEPITLISGFVDISMPSKLNVTSGNIIIGGATLPMVVAAGDKTGRLYFFALKVLLPNLC